MEQILERTKHQPFLTKKHAKQLANIIRSGHMIEEFYAKLFEMFDKNVPIVRDIKRIFEEKIKIHIKENNLTLEIKKTIINDELVKCLRSSPVKGIRKINQVYQFTEQEICTIMINEFSDFDSFIVMGCPESTDIDVVCFVRKQDINNGLTKELLPSSYNRLLSELKKLGYEFTSDMLDINCVYVDPNTKTIMASSKGGTETQNIINATWSFHQQVMILNEESKTFIPQALELHPMNDITFTDEEIDNKIRAFAKYALDYAEDSCRNYNELRLFKNELYANGRECMMTFMKQYLNWVVYDPSMLKENGLNLIKWHDRFKALTMKLIQIILIWHHDKSIYIKRDLAESVKEIYSDHHNINNLVSCANWYLFRGRLGEFDKDLFPSLVNTYLNIIAEFNDVRKPMVQSYNCVDILKKHTEDAIVRCVTPNMMKLFFESPEIVSPEFEQEWKTTYPDESINSLFVLQSSNENEFYDYYQNASKHLLDMFKKCFIFVDQRTPEWLDILQNKFICGTNSGSINIATFQGYYNLIRGAIIEMLAIDLFDFTQIGLNNFVKWNVGFIVEEDKKGAHGFAPDMLLISSSTNLNDSTQIELILVEIKGLKTLRHNSSYYRGLHLATNQIQSAKTILGNAESFICKRGIILLCSVEESEFKIEVHQRNLN